MGRIDHFSGLRAFVDDVAREASSQHGVPESIAAAAREATVRRFAQEAGWTAHAGSRARSYFWGVVRRRAMGSGRETAALRARYVAATVAEDLVAAGYPPDLARAASCSPVGVGAAAPASRDAA